MNFFLSAVCVFLFAFSAAGVCAPAEGKDLPNSLYLSIEKHSLAWIEGLFGSAKVRANELESLCDGSRGSLLITPYSYIMVSPYTTGSIGFVCSFNFESWLVIQGYVENAQLVPLRAARVSGSQWWRSAALVSISGKIRKFRLDSSPDGKRLILFLDGISFRTPDKDTVKP
jgi:hypothetical protein